eukprot:6335167-Prymnesium_polylepis.2
MACCGLGCLTIALDCQSNALVPNAIVWGDDGAECVARFQPARGGLPTVELPRLAVRAPR